MNILTFDIEEWFHILDHQATKYENSWNKYEARIHRNTDIILELLINKKQKATFFCLGWIAKNHPAVIKKIDNYGFNIGSHGFYHQLVYEQSKMEFRNDVEYSIKTIEDVIGKKIILYRTPGFSFTPQVKWAFETLIDLGIKIDCSVFPSKRGHGGFPDFPSSKPCIIDYNGKQLKEFPINFKKFINLEIIFSGGGYFRLIPYKLIKKFIEDSPYVMTYYHPRDFDPEQPLLPNLPVLKKFKSYYGLKNAFNKLNRLIDDFEFIDLKTADHLIKWDEAEIVRI